MVDVLILMVMKVCIVDDMQKLVGRFGLVGRGEIKILLEKDEILSVSYLYITLEPF
jgi:hypothetical protein